MNYNNCPVFTKNGRVFDSQMTNIEKILHSKKLNYAELQTLCDPYFKDNKCETINLYIDLFDVFKSLYSPLLKDEFETIRTDGRMSIISEILNIVAHYRHFFFSRYGKYTSIMLYYSNEKDVYFKSLLPEYKEDFYSKRLLLQGTEYYVVNKVISDCLCIVKEYLNYIPHAYLIDTGKMDPSAFPNAIMRGIEIEELKGLINPNDFNIIMSNSDLALVNIINDDNSIIFKNNGRGKSYFVNRHDAYSQLKIENIAGIPDSMLNYLLALVGSKSFGISNVNRMGYKKAYKYLVKKYSEHGNLSNIDVDTAFSDLKDNDMKILKRNLKLTDYKTYPMIQPLVYHICEQLIDIIDIEYIKQETFNNFDAKCIVLLDYLFDGEEV